MCVEIIKSESQASFKPELPFEEQIRDSTEIVIDCGPECKKVISFLNEMEKACKCGFSLPINIEVKTNDLNLFKKIKKLNKILTTNDIIGHMTKLYKKADDGLEEISRMLTKDKDVR